MKGFVADSSVVLAWLIADEASVEVDALLDSMVEGTAVESPVLLRYEVANVLVSAFTKRKRLTKEQSIGGLSDFDSLPIRYDVESPKFAATRTAELAATFLLSVYDAAYLELAQRRTLPLATQDLELKRAAVELGIEVI